MHRFMWMLLFCCLLSFSVKLFADQESANAALTDILFDMDMENVTYEVSERGGVDITFGISVPEDQFVATVSKLRNHPDINGVLSTRGMGDYCPSPR